MTPAISKVIFVALVIGWYLIRYEYARRSRRERVVSSARGPLETALLLISLSGLGLVPLIYIATAVPRFAAHSFHPILGWLGLFFAIAALGMFHLTHRALGRNWSISLDVRENHELVTNGVYRKIRHPMYSAFWLWAIAQALLLPNWVAGFSGLAGFGILFFGRVTREERMMLETFGASYRAYMARTGRVFPSISRNSFSETDLKGSGTRDDQELNTSNSVPFLQHPAKNDSPGC
jgi:protein-S-isoprenylcysteine O-methyltransferase Ste14